MSRTKVLVSIDENLLKVADTVCEEMEINRSRFIEMAVEESLREWNFVSYIGFTPSRAKKVGDALERIGLLKSGEYEFKVPKNMIARLKGGKSE